MNRSKWKGPFLDPAILRPITSQKKLNIWSRRSNIPFKFMDKHVFIHNGLGFQKILITRQKIGFKFGTFTKTRKFTKK